MVAFDTALAVIALGVVLAVETLARDRVAIVGVSIAVTGNTRAQIRSSLHSIVSLGAFL